MLSEEEIIELMTKTGESYLMGKVKEGTTYAKEMIHKLDFSEKRDQEVLIQVLGHALIRNDEIEVLDELNAAGFDFNMKFERGITLAEFFSKYDKFNSESAVYKKLAEFGVSFAGDDLSVKKLQDMFKKYENEYIPWWNVKESFTDYSFRIASDEVSNEITELAKKLSDEGAVETGSYTLSVLHQLVLHNYYEAVEELLKKGANPNIAAEGENGSYAAAYKGVTPLHLACYMGNYGMVKLLMENGADATITDACGRNAFHFLASINFDKMPDYTMGQMKTIEQRADIAPLLKADINAKDNEGNTPVNQLLTNPKLSKVLIKPFMEKGADFSIKDEEGNTPLICAALNNSITAAMLLMKDKSTINAQNNDGNTALHIAAKEWNSEIAYALLEAGADTGISNNEGKTATEIIEEDDNEVLVKRISSKRGLPLKDQFRIVERASFDISEEDDDKLLFALEVAKKLLKEIDEDDDDEVAYIIELVECLLREDENCEILDIIEKLGIDFCMPITYSGKTTNVRDCCLEENFGIRTLKKLNSMGIDLNSAYIKGRTPANIIAGMDKKEFYFGEKKSDYFGDATEFFDTESFEMINDEGLSAMHLAAWHGHLEMIRKMAEKGADINGITDAPHEAGMTPLHMACKYGKADIIKELIKLGADDTIKNEKGETPAHIAVCKKIFHKEISEEERIEMIEALSNVDIADNDGRTPIMMLQLQDYGMAYSVTGTFLDKDVDVNHADNNGNTVLLLHTDRHCNKDVVKELIRAGADVNAKNKNGDTALHFALVNGNTDVARFLIKKGADYNTANNKGKTPIEIAVENGYETVLELMTDI